LERDGGRLPNSDQRASLAGGRPGRGKEKHRAVSSFAGTPIRLVLIALVAIPALYLTFLFYLAGSTWIALGSLLLVLLFIYIYSSRRAYTYRYLFPGLFAFGLFVIFPLIYTVWISFTKYSSTNLQTFKGALSVFRQETFLANQDSYSYNLYRQNDGTYILYLKNEKDPNKTFISEPFELVGGKEPDPTAEPIQLKASSPDALPAGEKLKLPQITREKLFIGMRGRKFLLPDDTLVQAETLQLFTARERLWKFNPDGTLTNKKNGMTIHPDFKQGFFVNDKGERIGVGFRTFAGFDNYMRIVTDPQLQGPFFRIFVWTVCFSAFSVLGTFATGLLLATILEWKELRFRRIYRVLLILPYAVPSILSILIFKGLFNQEFGAINEVLRGLLHFAPEWETNPWGARAMILLVNLWLGYPYMMLICTGMLQSIPGGIYEASAIDGSNPLVDFFKLTLPLVLPPLIPVLIASFAFNFNNFSLIYLLTAGGPRMVGGGLAGETDILVTYTYTIAFRDAGTNYSLSSTVATILFLIVGSLAYLNLRLSGRRVKL
jgi:maltose/maltodextrin transport system permease protein